MAKKKKSKKKDKKGQEGQEEVARSRSLHRHACRRGGPVRRLAPRRSQGRRARRGPGRHQVATVGSLDLSRGSSYPARNLHGAEMVDPPGQRPIDENPRVALRRVPA